MPDARIQPARGTLVTFTIIRKAPAPSRTPLYAVAIVDLADGRRVLGRSSRSSPRRAWARVTLARWAKDTPVFAPDHG